MSTPTKVKLSEALGTLTGKIISVLLAGMILTYFIRLGWVDGIAFIAVAIFSLGSKIKEGLLAIKGP